MGLHLPFQRTPYSSLYIDAPNTTEIYWVVKLNWIENYKWIFIGIILFRMQIRAALNQQTAVQFAQYAQQQCPNNKQQVSHTKLSQFIIIVDC